MNLHEMSWNDVLSVDVVVIDIMESCDAMDSIVLINIVVVVFISFWKGGVK